MPHFETDANNLYFLATVPIHSAFIGERAFLASIGKDLDEVIEKTAQVSQKTGEVIRENAQMSQKTDEVSQKNVFLLQQILLLAQRAHDLSDKMSLEVLESIFSQINKNKSVSMAELAQHSSTSLATIKRYLSHLYEYGIIIHYSPDKGEYRTFIGMLSNEAFCKITRDDRQITDCTPKAPKLGEQSYQVVCKRNMDNTLNDTVEFRHMFLQTF